MRDSEGLKLVFWMDTPSDKYEATLCLLVTSSDFQIGKDFKSVGCKSEVNATDYAQ